MMEGRMMLYCGGERGYVVAPHAFVKGDVGSMAMREPATFLLSAGAGPEELGRAVLDALATSVRIGSLPRSELEDFASLQALARARSRAQFVRVYRDLLVKRLDEHLDLAECPQVPGRRTWIGGPVLATLPAGASPAEVGRAVLAILGREVPAGGPLALETFRGSRVTLDPPSPELFLDLGDAHAAEVCQSYALEADERAQVALMTDDGYASLDEAGIRARWEREYGPLPSLSLSRPESGAASLEAVAGGPGGRVRALFFPDGDGWLEARADAPSSGPGADPAAWAAMGAVLDSVRVAPAT